REAQGIALVYSVCSRESFLRLEHFWKAIKRVRGEDFAKFVLVANKCDKAEAEREVSWEEGLALTQKWGCALIETSALRCDSGGNVDVIYERLVRLLR
ncbi:ras-domain-containing protein, partial [Agrocybe pediades]